MPKQSRISRGWAPIRGRQALNSARPKPFHNAARPNPTELRVEADLKASQADAPLLPKAAKTWARSAEPSRPVRRGSGQKRCSTAQPRIGPSFSSAIGPRTPAGPVQALRRTTRISWSPLEINAPARRPNVSVHRRKRSKGWAWNANVNSCSDWMLTPERESGSQLESCIQLPPAGQLSSARTVFRSNECSNRKEVSLPSGFEGFTKTFMPNVWLLSDGEEATGSVRCVLKAAKK